MVADKTDERHLKEQMLIHARAGTPREHETLALVAQGYWKPPSPPCSSRHDDFGAV
jgi:hypothetical protein